VQIVIEVTRDQCFYDADKNTYKCEVTFSKFQTKSGYILTQKQY